MARLSLLRTPRYLKSRLAVPSRPSSAVRSTSFSAIRLHTMPSRCQRPLTASSRARNSGSRCVSRMLRQQITCTHPESLRRVGGFLRYGILRKMQA